MKSRVINYLLVAIFVFVVCTGCSEVNDSETQTIISATNEVTNESTETVTNKVTEPVTVVTTTAQVQNYPQYPIYVRTMGVGSVGCEYGYCELGEKSGEEILAELSEFSYFFNSPDHREDVALYYDEEPQDVKLYHAVAGSTEYEEYAFAGSDYEFPWNVEPKKYVICVPKEYGTHYFFAVITWKDGKKDLMYFTMVYGERKSQAIR